ncbi:DUF421 domain-containing protein [Bombella sp. ESL0378]|uniref:DUF421 domain-containing protein n=1 Tax=unclassified Bombella TaxID=2644098 RepID=UPI0012D8A588|nr:MULTISPECIES: YetF domain-containing protein [unclassified Bombella]MUG05385.1 DUF421 domain-containing protein [Bombella sp. ESL0378]MUG89456.1 DUF421 domain-containing protein [Bombella sp. ESL0385]
MLHQLFPNLALNIWMFLKLVTGFAIIIGYLNISGRSQVSQMNAIDLVGNFILGGLVGGVLYTTNISFHEYVIALLIGVGILLTITRFCRKINMFRNVAIGRQIPIIKDGRFLMENIRDKNNKIDMLNIASQLNLQGIYSFDEVYFAQVEPSGALTAITDKKKLPALIVYYDGVIREDDLKDVGLSGDDLKEDAKRKGIESLDDVFMAEIKDKQFHYVLMNGLVVPHPRKDREQEEAKKLAEEEAKKKAEERKDALTPGAKEETA